VRASRGARRPFHLSAILAQASNFLSYGDALLNARQTTFIA
jgi:hypothetical protein